MEIEDIVAWYHAPRAAAVSGERTLELYFQLHPRTAFLKTLRPGATVADIGAGDGSLSLFRGWPDPARQDLRIYAYAMEKGERFDAFDGYELGDWNEGRPFAEEAFDGIVCGHFIEHVADPGSLLDWAGERLAPGGRAYVEWPSPHSRVLPSRALLAEHGVDLVISRFDDDCTHLDVPDRNDMIERARHAGLAAVVQGTIRLPWLEEQLLANFRDAQDRFPVQAAFWSWTGWSQYVVLEKPAAGGRAFT